MSEVAGAAAQGALPRVAGRLREIRTRIERACERAGRDPASVTLVGVTKKVPVERIREAIDAGLQRLGENRLQEAVDKMRDLSERAPTWHFIGHLQTNKARRAVELFDRIDTVDSLKLARGLEGAAEEIGRELRVFVQVRLDEEKPHGVLPADLPALVRDVNALPRLNVSGLMTIPPPRPDPESSRADFRRMRSLFEELAGEHPELRHLSMGMSADFEVAIEEGATEVRVGTALFGSR